MLERRDDILGELARLRREMLAPERPSSPLVELEVLAAVAVVHGLSYNTVRRASGISRGRIEALRASSPDLIEQRAADYVRRPTGEVVRISR